MHTSDWFDLLMILDRSVIDSEPFPHLVIRNAICPQVCKALFDEFPSLVAMRRGMPARDNWRYNVFVKQALEARLLKAYWRRFIDVNVSGRQMQRLLLSFGQYIKKTYPLFGDTSEIRVGCKGR